MLNEFTETVEKLTFSFTRIVWAFVLGSMALSFVSGYFAYANARDSFGRASPVEGGTQAIGGADIRDALAARRAAECEIATRAAEDAWNRAVVANRLDRQSDRIARLDRKRDAVCAR